MFGHELRRAGRIDEAIGEFEAADRLEAAYLKNEGVPVERNWHYPHNLDLLGTSYQYIGQMSKAEELLRKSFAIPSDSLEQELNKREWPVFLLARGRASEALTAAGTLAAHPSPLVSAIGHIEAGQAKLAVKQFQAAADEGNMALRLMRSAAQRPDLLATALKQLQGEYFLRTGNREKGRTALRQVANDVRAAPGPDGWVQALFTLEVIARTAREVNDWDFAGWAAEQMLEHDPNYAGTHAALAFVADHMGDHATLRAELARARTLWSKADSDMRNMDWLPKESQR
jgi:tetratricopeptide (TPR) repeat protein